MAFNISHDYLQETCFVLAILGVSLAIIATVLRFVAVRLGRRKPGWEDWFAVLATFFFIIYVIPLIYLLSVMNGESTWTAAQVVKIKKSGYSMGPQFCMNQLFAKLSILFLYRRLFHVNERFLYCVWFLGIVQVAWSIATYLAHFLECIPTARLWDKTIEGHCINSSAFLAAGETPNSLVDFALIGLAIWMVQSLKSIKTSEKIRLYVIFTIGGLAGVLGFVKIGQGFGAISKSKVELLDPIWATVQQTCSVICCCAPLYKPLFSEIGLFNSLHSLTSSVLGRGSSNGGTVVGAGDNYSQLQDCQKHAYGGAYAIGTKGMKPMDRDSKQRSHEAVGNDWVEMHDSISRKTLTSQSHILSPV